MALTLERMTDFAGVTPSRGTYPIAANVRILKGAQVALDSAGRAIPATTAAGGAVRVVGKASATFDNRDGSVLGGAAGACDVEVEFGVFGWANSSAGDALADADVGAVVYAVDDQTVAKTDNGGTRVVAGILTEVRNGQCYVFQSPAIAHLALAAVEADAGVAMQKRTVTIGHADLDAAATTQTINVGAVLPANARILGVSLHDVTAFSGGTVSALELDIGTAGDVDAIVAQADLAGAAVDGQAASCPSGIAPHKLFAAAGAQLAAKFTATGDDLVNLTAGAVTIDVLFSVLA